MDGPPHHPSSISLEAFSERSDSSPRRPPSSPAKSIDKPTSPVKSPPRRPSPEKKAAPSKSPVQSPTRSPPRPPPASHPSPSHDQVKSSEGEEETPAQPQQDEGRGKAAAAASGGGEGNEQPDKETALREKLQQRRPAKIVRPAATTGQSPPQAVATPTGGENGQARNKRLAKNARSCTVRVDGFIRPFRLPAAKELLESKGGEKLGEDCFWMNNIKTHCYATFQTEEAAARAREALEGIVWPETHGGTLRADFAAETAADAAKGVVPAKSPRGPVPTEGATGGSGGGGGAFSGREGEYTLTLKRDLSSRLGPPVSRQGSLADNGAEEAAGVGVGRGFHADIAGAKKKRELGPSPERARKVTKLEGEGEAPGTSRRGGAPNLDELFRSTKAQPKLYWQPVAEDQVAVKRTKVESNLKRNLDPGGRPYHDPRDDER